MQHENNKLSSQLAYPPTKIVCSDSHEYPLFLGASAIVGTLSD